MIVDLLENRQRYTGLGKNLAAAFDYLASTDLAALLPGRIDLDGEALYALVQEYTPKALEQGKWEAHQRYIDVQYMLRGVERVGVAHISTMRIGEYDPLKDFLPMQGKGSLLDLFAGSFMLFYPGDAHMPGLAAGQAEMVKKVVMKVRV